MEHSCTTPITFIQNFFPSRKYEKTKNGDGGDDL